MTLKRNVGELGVTFLLALTMLLGFSGFVGACGPQSPEIVPDSWLIHRDLWHLPYTDSRWQDGLVDPWAGFEYRGYKFIQETADGVMGSVQREFNELDQLILSGKLEKAESYFSEIGSFVDQLSFSARPEFSPLRFYQRRLWHRRQVLDLLKNGPPPLWLEDYLAWRGAYETPLAKVVSEATMNRRASISYQQNAALWPQLQDQFQPFAGALEADDLPAGWLSLLSYDRAVLSYGQGEMTQALEGFSRAGEVLGPAQDRARFMTARLMEASHPKLAAGLYQKLEKSKMAPEALLRRAHLAHQGGHYALASAHYRSFWQQFPDHPDLVQVDRSSRDLLGRPQLPLPGSLLEAFQWMARRQGRPEALVTPKDPFYRWLQRRWTVRALYRDGAQVEAAALAEILLNEGGKSDRAFVGNLWSNLLWAGLIYNPDMSWGDPVFPKYLPVRSFNAKSIDPLLREFAGTEWALAALFHTPNGQEAPVVLSSAPWHSALRFGGDRFLINHLMRRLPIEVWPENHRDSWLFVHGDLPALLTKHPNSKWAKRAILESVESMERGHFQWDQGFYGSVKDNPVKPVVLEEVALNSYVQARVNRDKLAQALKGWAEGNRETQLSTLIFFRLREFDGYQNGTPSRPKGKITLKNSEDPLAVLVFLGNLRQAHFAGLSVKKAAPGWQKTLERLPTTFALRNLPVAREGYDFELSAKADLLKEWRARLLFHEGRWRPAMDLYLGLGFPRDASLALQTGATDKRLQQVLDDETVNAKLRVEAGLLLLRPRLISLKIDQAERIWQSMIKVDEKQFHSMLRTSHRAQGDACDTGPDFVWKGEARCLDDLGPILEDLAGLSKALDEAKPNSFNGAQAAYDLARYAYHNTAALFPGAGRLAYERSFPQGFFWWQKHLFPQDLAEGHFYSVSNNPKSGDLGVRALYTLGVMALKERTTLTEETAQEYFLTLVLNHPQHALADDALHWAKWARELAQRQPKQTELDLWAKVEALDLDFSTGDIALHGGAMDVPRALHVPEEVLDKNLGWFEHSLDHNFSGPTWQQGYRFVWRKGVLYVVFSQNQTPLPVLHVRQRYDGAKGTQVKGPWRAINLKELSQTPPLGLGIPANLVLGRDYIRGDVLELKWDWAPDVPLVFDPESSGSGVLLVLRGDMHPRDLTRLGSGYGYR